MTRTKLPASFDAGAGRIPFGLNVATGEFVDVSDVPRGSASGCVCPSCRVPLQAKQGEVNRWHFAHESRGTYELAADQCDFSIWTAMVLMARQELGRSDTFCTPDYILTERVGPGCPWEDLSEVVTRGKRVCFSAPRIETSFAGVTWDAILDVRGSPLCVILTHRQKHFSVEQIANRGDARLGVVRIDLIEAWEETTRLVAESSMSYRNAFRQTLIDGLAGKQWASHPRAESALETLRRRVLAMPKLRSLSFQDATDRLARNLSSLDSTARASPSRGTVRCYRCNTAWSDPKSSREVCPGCGVEGTWILADWTE